MSCKYSSRDNQVNGDFSRDPTFRQGQGPRYEDRDTGTLDLKRTENSFVRDDDRNQVGDVRSDVCTLRNGR